MALQPILSDRLRVPIVGAPMFIVSNPELVIAQCTSGIIGSFPTLNARPQSELRAWLDHITTALTSHDAQNPDAQAAPFATNLIVHRSNDRLDEDLATIVEFKVPIVITSLGARPEVNDAVHSYGGMVFHDVVTNAFAEKAIDKGADGLVAVAAGAGGHGRFTVAVRIGPGDPHMVRRTSALVWGDSSWPVYSRRTGSGR